MSGDTSTDITAEKKLVSIEVDELCEIIDSEVKSVIKMESCTSETSPKIVKDTQTVNEQDSENSAGAQKRPGEPDNGIENVKKPKFDGNEEETASTETTRVLDIWDEDPTGLYGLSPKFLKLRGITTPLTNWVHLSNIPSGTPILKEAVKMAGNVLVFHVVHTNPAHAKVMYSHPIEAAQAVSMLNGHLLAGKPLSVSIDPGPHKEFLPIGMRTLGLGFSNTGKPLKDVVRHFKRHLQGKSTLLSNSLFGAEDVVTEDEEKTEDDDSATKGNETKSPEIKTAQNTEAAAIITKDKMNQTCLTSGNRTVLEIVDELKSNGVPMSDIIKALKALKPARDKSGENGQKSSPPKSTESKDDSRLSRSSSFTKSVPARISARSVSPKRTHNPPSFGPRYGSSGSFRPNGPRMVNNRNFGPGNNNFGPGPNPAPFNNFGPQAPNGPPNNGPFLQQSGPGPFVGNPPQAFGGNFGNPATFGSNSGPSGPFGGNTGPSGPFGPNISSGPNQPFGGNNFGAGVVPQQNMMGSGGPAVVPQQNMMGSGGPIERSTSNVVILNNLPPSVTFPLLTDKMNTCGVVQYLNVTKPGTAMVRYACDWEAARCISTFDKTVVDGHKIEVRYA